MIKTGIYSVETIWLTLSVWGLTNTACESLGCVTTVWKNLFICRKPCNVQVCENWVSVMQSPMKLSDEIRVQIRMSELPGPFLRTEFFPDHKILEDNCHCGMTTAIFVYFLVKKVPKPLRPWCSGKVDNSWSEDCGFNYSENGFVCLPQLCESQRVVILDNTSQPQRVEIVNFQPFEDDGDHEESLSSSPTKTTTESRCVGIVGGWRTWWCIIFIGPGGTVHSKNLLKSILKPFDR